VYYNEDMNKKIDYNQYAAFIDREMELKELRRYIDKQPSEILFFQGPTPSGKATLLNRFLAQIQKRQ
jgi:AAA+ ATPase superfamily predicted ATPase